MVISKWIGAIFICCSCGGFAYVLAKNHRNDIRLLKQFISLLDYMECELQYTMPALPDLFRLAAGEAEGILREVFQQMANQLEGQMYSEVKSCIESVTQHRKDIPPVLKDALKLYGEAAGRFDLQGQITRLQGVREECRRKLSMLVDTKESRMRSYQMLGLCGGAALIILLM